MDDKYFKLQDIVIDKFDLDAPIEIEKGVLFLDKSSRDVLLQMKLNILGIDNSRLSSVSVSIDCMDDASEIIADISPYTYTYRDIFLNKSRSFGEDSPILLDQRVRKVKIGIQRVVFNDSTLWYPASIQFTPPKQELITSLKPELVEQFQRDIHDNSPAVKESYSFIPKQLDNYWLCTCGRPNHNDSEHCLRCGLSKEKVFLLSEETLQIKLNQYKAQILLEEEKAQNEEEHEAKLREEGKIRSKRRRTLLVITSLVGLLIAVFLFAILPASIHRHQIIWLIRITTMQSMFLIPWVIIKTQRKWSLRRIIKKRLTFWLVKNSTTPSRPFLTSKLIRILPL